MGQPVSAAQHRTVEEHLRRGVEPGGFGAALWDVGHLPLGGQELSLSRAGLLVGLQRHVVQRVDQVLAGQRRQRRGWHRRRRGVVDPLVVHVVHGGIFVNLLPELGGHRTLSGEWPWCGRCCGPGGGGGSSVCSCRPSSRRPSIGFPTGSVAHGESRKAQEQVGVAARLRPLEQQRAEEVF